MFDLKKFAHGKANKGDIYLCIHELSREQILAWRDFIVNMQMAIRQDWQLTEISAEEMEVRKDGAFAVISSSASLGRKILENFNQIFIFPQDRPRKIDPWLLYKLEQCNLASDELSPSGNDVSLISSVFNADKYLSGFLENSSALIGYQEYQHLLIAPNSPGNEHNALLAHVKKWPLAVYIHLPEDPGLYEVWNLGARLATGRYLSNANLDDRRSPEHVQKLKTILDTHPNVAAAAGALRVSQIENLAWHQSADCSTMFSDIAHGEYQFDDLFRKVQGQWASRNFLHCMPLWRRDLHLRFGWFDEKQFGPSADWEFWLRCGHGGSIYYFTPEPLGVYLKIESSYWRREPKNKILDEKIVHQYKSATAPDQFELSVSCLNRPVSFALREATSLFESAYPVEAIAGLIRILGGVQNEIEKFLNFADGVSRFHLDLEARGWMPQVVPALYAGGQAVGIISHALALIFHALLEKTIPAKARAINNFEIACFDIIDYGEETSGNLLLASLQKILQNNKKKYLIIDSVFKKDARLFWENIQKIYFFKNTSKFILEELVGKKSANGVDCCKKNINLAFYPAFSANSYLDLLYEPYRSDPSNIIEGYLDFSEFIQHQYQQGKENILHIHWINSIWNGRYEKNGEEKFAIQSLRQAQERGFQIYWTIHNYVSHASSNVEEEINFRKKLYQLADKIFVHHPLAISELDWLPDSKKVHVFEHGAYPVTENCLGPEEAVSLEKFIGLDKGQLLITIVGQIRAYKGLEKLLPVMIHLTNENSSIKFLIAGKIKDPSFAKLLKRHSTSNIKIIDEHLSLPKLNHIMKMSDFGLLSYGRILTSGTLFHWLSAGKPVLAPRKGTIPAYVVNGWNGYIYDDLEHLTVFLKKIAKIDKKNICSMGVNALSVVASLKWENFDT